MQAKAPRVVLVTRKTEYELLVARHGTRSQAEFFLKSRGQTLEVVDERHHRFHEALHRVSTAVPLSWRRNAVERKDLTRFLFEPDDLVVVVGRDGLVANAAKYLRGQRVLGINPEPSQNVGILVPHAPEAIDDLLSMAARNACSVQARTMVEARLSDGQTLPALNEIFVGCRTHQSARYQIKFGDATERQSSSGIIISTGTGATGWALSIHRQRRTELALPAPDESRLTFFVREAFPSIASGAEVTEGSVSDALRLEVTSEMNSHGVLFGDGIEEDALPFDWGVTAEVGIAPHKLQLVI